MKKKKFANLIMVAVILAIAVAGILTVGFIQGWFGGNEDAALLTDIRGIVTMERDGIAYNLQEDTSLREDDQISFAADASAVISLGENSTISLGAEAELTIQNADSASFSAELSAGEAVVECQSAIMLNEIMMENGVTSLHSEDGTWVMQEYSGEQSVALETLTDFQLHQLNKVVGICFTAEELKQEESRRKEQMDASTVPTKGEGPSSEEMTLSCTIEILCDTILNNMDQMDAAKTAYVPEDGVILRAEVPFAPGEAVIDVLKRACETNHVQIEYSWTPLYDSYYVEGINNIYEFDCGAESGWMYKVNDWFPNYGCSDYVLEGGEVITWCYSCVGLGADVGGSNWK